MLRSGPPLVPNPCGSQPAMSQPCYARPLKDPPVIPEIMGRKKPPDAPELDADVPFRPGHRVPVPRGGAPGTGIFKHPRGALQAAFPANDRDPITNLEGAFGPFLPGRKPRVRVSKHPVPVVEGPFKPVPTQSSIPRPLRSQLLGGAWYFRGITRLYSGVEAGGSGPARVRMTIR